MTRIHVHNLGDRPTGLFIVARQDQDRPQRAFLTGPRFMLLTAQNCRDLADALHDLADTIETHGAD